MVKAMRIRGTPLITTCEDTPHPQLFVIYCGYRVTAVPFIPTIQHRFDTLPQRLSALDSSIVYP